METDHVRFLLMVCIIDQLLCDVYYIMQECFNEV